MRKEASIITAVVAVAILLISSGGAAKVNGQTSNSEVGQDGGGGGRAARDSRKGVRAVTIPITVRPRESGAQQELQAIGNLKVFEDGDEQTILSYRFISTSPLSVAVLIQDDVVPSISNEIKAMGDFIRRLPRGSRVFVGYITRGTLQIRQRFTTDLDRAANSLRIPVGSATAAPFNPYVEIVEALRRFESLPAGRRAMLVVSDGLDTSRGVDSASPSQSIDLQRAIREAQRHSVAIYSFYAPTVTATAGNNSFLVGAGQGSLETLSEETGGRAFFQGTGAPVSFDPFLRSLATSLARQFAITYLSTHPGKGFHRIRIESDRRDIEIDHPAGYTRR